MEELALSPDPTTLTPAASSETDPTTPPPSFKTALVERTTAWLRPPMLGLAEDFPGFRDGHVVDGVVRIDFTPLPAGARRAKPPAHPVVELGDFTDIKSMARAGEHLLLLDLKAGLLNKDAVVYQGITLARVAFHVDANLRGAQQPTNYLGLNLDTALGDLVLVNMETGLYRSVPELDIVFKEWGKPKFSLGTDGTLIMTFEDGELQGALFGAQMHTLLAFIEGKVPVERFWTRGDSLLAGPNWQYAGFAATRRRLHTITLISPGQHPRLMPFVVQWEDGRPFADPRPVTVITDLPPGSDVIFKGMGYCSDQVNYLCRASGQHVQASLATLPSLHAWAGME